MALPLKGRTSFPLLRCVAVILIALCCTFPSAGCSSTGTAPDAGEEESPEAVGQEASFELPVTPTPGTPLACPRGDDCPDEACVDARQAINLGMYPWVSRMLTTGDTSLYGVFLDFQTPEYAVIGESISGTWWHAFASAILNTIYNGPSGASAQHLYEVAILAWLEYDGGVNASFDDEGVVDPVTDIVLTMFGLTADHEVEFASTYDEFAAAWEGLTGEDLGSLAEDSAMLKRLSEASGNVWFATQSMERFTEVWSGLNSALGADEERIALLSAARDEAEKAGNDDFVAAADRVINAYEDSVGMNLVFNEDGVGLGTSQGAAALADTVMRGVWSGLTDKNPLLSLGMDAMDLLLSTSEDSEADMGMLATYVLDQYLRLALSDSFQTMSGEFATGGEVPSAAAFIKNWRAYLEFQLFALDESAQWARVVSNRPWMNQDGARAIIDNSVSQQQSRRTLLDKIDQFERSYCTLADRALTGTCACGCAAQAEGSTSTIDLESFSGTYRRFGSTDRAWSSFEITPESEGLLFSHEAMASNHMLSLTNYQPLSVAFVDGTGSADVESLDYGDVALTFTLNADGSFELSCGIDELDGSYVPEDTPRSEEEMEAQETEDATLEADILDWLTAGSGVWMLEDTMSDAGVAYLALSPDGTVTRWLCGYAGIEGTGTFSLDGDHITLSLVSFGSSNGTATYAVNRFTADGVRKIRLDLVSDDGYGYTAGYLEGWYDEGEPWWD